MSIKEELIEIKNKITSSKKKKISKSEYITLSNEISKVARENNKTVDRKTIDLNSKIKNFINWYKENMVKGKYTETGEYYEPIRMENLIEKVAIWFELRYPTYEVNRLMPGSGQEQININDIMFKNNQYINDLLDEDNDAKELEWADFYNTHSFISSLPWEERWVFSKPSYRYKLYLDEDHDTIIYLTENGVVFDSTNIDIFTDEKITLSDIKGKHIKKVYELFKKKNIELPKDNDIEKAIKNGKKQEYQKQEMLNCIMYKIIERGGPRIGPRRGFLFAKEFGLDIDIPMKYAIDRTDPGLRRFINEYIKSGGSKDLECYINYYSHYHKNDKIETITIQELLLKVSNNAATFYTKEEDELHQRLVNALSNRSDYKKFKENEIKTKRLERKITKQKYKNN